MRESIRDLLGRRRNDVSDNRRHLEEAVAWLCRAQDVTPDGGVARSYSLVYKPFFGKKGWLGSYPETTGYIIPTLLDYAQFAGREDLRRRAIRMADWEIEVQMSHGAVVGGTIDFPPTPAVFNTGQVILGWCRVFRETGDARYLDAARRAGDYLVSCQNEDGAWCRGSSRFARRGSTVYNTRVSWGLVLLADLTGDARYREAAIRNLDWALSKQRANGWFADNCLDDPDRPLVHTIAYAVQGILEAGIALGETRYIERAAETARVMAELLRADGSLAGRYDRAWRPAAAWSCLTGNMQMSVIWSSLHARGIVRGLNEAAAHINGFNRSLHDWRAADAGIRGGVKGSYPVYGDYGRFEYLNWAVKFTVDALLLEERGRGARSLLPAFASSSNLFYAA